MTIHPGQEDAPRQPPEALLLVQQHRIPPKIDVYPAMKMTHTAQVAVIIPADDQQPIGRPVLDFTDKTRIDQPTEGLQAGTAGRIGDKFVFITIQQRDIPLYRLAEAAVIHHPAAALLIRIKYL